MRKFDKKQRNTHKKNPKPVIAIVAEGNNVTEAQYFNSFNNQNSKCTIKIVRAGGKTDPEKLLAELESYWKNYDLDSSIGDRAFVVLDLDCDRNKAARIREIKCPTGIDFIISNPCFELWFLLHFVYSTHAFSGSNEAIHFLERYIPGYSKTKDVSLLLESKLDQAIKNSEKLEQYFDSLEMQWPSADCNPRTDAGNLIKLITGKNN